MSPITSFDEFVPQLRSFMAQSLTFAQTDADTDSEFNRLALALFALQSQTVPIYREFCASRNFSDVHTWRGIPALPTSAFKEYQVSSIPPSERTRVFHSSGTTQQTPSCHFHKSASLEIYESSLRPWFQENFLNPKSEIRNPKLILLTPPPAQAPNSSLVHMFESIRHDFPLSQFTGGLDAQGAWIPGLDATVAALAEAQSSRQPIALLGTAFLFVHLLDHCKAAQTRFRLPAGSRVMETGGYKGRSRAIPKAGLRQLITRWLGIPDSHILTEYGMSELSSQAYDRVIPGPTGPLRFPPWARAQIISPETGREVTVGETGMVRVFDLANVYSVMSVQTEDLAVRCDDGFELIGRAAEVEPRGCSLQTP